MPISGKGYHIDCKIHLKMGSQFGSLGSTHPDSSPVVFMLRDVHSKGVRGVIAHLVLLVPRGGGYFPTIPIRVCASQRGLDFRPPDLERGIHFRDVSYNGV